MAHDIEYHDLFQVRSAVRLSWGGLVSSKALKKNGLCLVELDRQTGSGIGLSIEWERERKKAPGGNVRGLSRAVGKS